MADPEALVPMRISGTGSLTDCRAGFSLIELVVVTTIISVLSLGLVIGAGARDVMDGNRADGPERRARALEEAVSATRDQALLMRRLHALKPRVDGWEILRRERGQWHEAASASGDGQIRWNIEGLPFLPLAELSASDIAPPVLFLEDGRVTTFAATFGASGGVIHCATDGWEAFRCRKR